MKKYMALVLIVSLALCSMAALADKGPIDRVDIIHYKDGTSAARGSAAARPPSTTCYSASYWMATPVQYYINTAGPMDISAITASAEEWDSHTSRGLFLGHGLTSTHEIVYDGKNVIFFEPYPDANVIGVTSFWYYRKTKEIVEWDMQLNTYFSWGDATIDPDVMDIQNIATHEFGHTLGLGDLYRTTCSAVTMYGYSTEGETSKRTLETQDIAGLTKIYGI